MTHDTKLAVTSCVVTLMGVLIGVGIAHNVYSGKPTPIVVNPTPVTCNPATVNTFSANLDTASIKAIGKELQFIIDKNDLRIVPIFGK
jgi:hypothetical protein